MPDIIDYFMDTERVLADTRRQCAQQIADAAIELQSCLAHGNTLYICGNGGSAAHAQHLAAELVPLGYPAVALTTDTSFITAWGNDVAFDSIFAQQLDTLGNAGDVLLAISTSGRSPNIRNAASCAKRIGMQVIALTGNNPDVFPGVGVAIRVPSGHTQHVQEAHTAILHVLVELVKQEMGDPK